MEKWQKLLKDSITNFEQLNSALAAKNITTDKIISSLDLQFPFKINPYYFNLIQAENDPIWKQSIPSIKELNDNICIADPLGEEAHSPTPGLVHKYPDRVLLLVTNQCSMYCRFCTRNRKVGQKCMSLSENDLDKCFDYIRKNKNVREVLISGGDPLLLSDNMLDKILSELRKINNVEIIRIGSRIPCTLPQRITDSLVETLKKYHPLYINTHFNHPQELTDEAYTACTKLADAGIPLGCQTVLLKDVNDSSEVLKELFLGLLKMRVKPYYLFQADLTRGTNHFRTHSKVGIQIMKELYCYISGMAVPRLALDAPGGKGKIPLSPEYVLQHGENLIFKNYLDEVCEYPEVIDYL